MLTIRQMLVQIIAGKKCIYILNATLDGYRGIELELEDSLVLSNSVVKNFRKSETREGITVVEERLKARDVSI